MCTFSLGYSIRGRGTLKISKSLWKIRITGFLVNCLFIIRFFIFPWYNTGTAQVLFKVSSINFSNVFNLFKILVISFICTACQINQKSPKKYYFQTCWVVLGYSFHQSLYHMPHLFEGVHFVSDTPVTNNVDNGTKESFLYRHIATNSSSGGEVLCCMYGGVHHHIEHHLFPRINHVHLPKMRQIIREFCAEKGIPYNYFPSWWDLMGSSLKHLYVLGHDDIYSSKPINFKRK